MPAHINLSYFMSSYDVQQEVVTTKMARAFTYTAPFSDLVTEEVIPGLSKISWNAFDADWAQWLKSTHRRNFHYVSTAATMPKDLGGVVDSTLRVYGTSNFHVVDASILSFYVRSDLASTLYVVAEKAMVMVKAKYVSAY